MCRHGGMKPTCTIFGLSSMKGRLIMGNNICKGTPPLWCLRAEASAHLGLEGEESRKIGNYLAFNYNIFV